MLLLLRKVLFYILFIFYLILTPALILYGIGYKPSQGELIKTGLVSIVSEPKNAALYIEGRKFSQRTPAIVRGMRPGAYQVKVIKKSFESWSKEIQIHPEKATRLEPVILLPQRPEWESMGTQPFQSILPRSAENKIFAFKQNYLADLVKVDLLFKKETPLVKSELPGASDEIIEWKMKKDSKVILLKTRHEGKTGYLLYDLDKEKIIKDLTGHLPDSFSWADWRAKKPKAIYFLKDEVLSEFNFENKLERKITEDRVAGFGVQRNKIYFLKKDFSFWQSDLHGGDITPLSERDDNGARIFSGIQSSYYQMEALKHELFQKELLLFTSDRGALLSNWPPYRLVENGVLGFKHASGGDTEKILYWTKNEIGMFDFAFNSEEEEMVPPKMILYRSGTDIKQAYWAYENSHVVFQDKNEIFLLEAGYQAPYIVRTVQTIASGTQAFYNDSQHSLYYLDFQTKNLIKRKITE